METIVKKTPRDSRIELLRFIASTLILIEHLGLIGIHLFGTAAWVYVEFFFMITGYFTACHFLEKKDESGNPVKYSIKFTIQKFIKFLPYTTGAILIKYILSALPDLKAGNWHNVILTFENMPFEMLYLSAANRTHGTNLFTIWFISAMFIVFPLFCLILSIKNKSLVFLISFLFPVFFYLFEYDFGSHTFPNQLIRAFAGLLAGTFLYFLSKKIRSLSINKPLTVILSLVEYASYLIPLMLFAFNKRALRLDLICFAVVIVLVFSEKTKSLIINSNFFTFLGKLSMPVFIWQFVFLEIAKLLKEYYNNTIVVSFYIAGTLIISLINMLIVHLVKKHNKK